MKRHTFLTLSNLARGHGSFPRHQRIARALVERGHRVIWIGPKGYSAPGIDAIPLALDWLPNLAFVGLYVKILATIFKHRDLMRDVTASFAIREYDAFGLFLQPSLRGRPRVFFSRGDVISINQLTSPDEKALADKLRRAASLFAYPWVQKVVLRLADTVVVQADFLLDLLTQRHAALSFHGIVLPNDCPSRASGTEPVDETDRTAADVGTLQLGFVAPLFWEGKGLAVIVEMVRELQARGMSYRLHIAGDGPHRERLREALSSPELEDKVVWHGWVEDVPGFLRTIDLVVVTSLYDSNPNLVLEALVENTPLLASDIPAHREMLVHEDLLFESRNASALCDKVQAFQAEPSLRRRVTDLVAQRRSARSFDWDAEVVKIMESPLEGSAATGGAGSS